MGGTVTRRYRRALPGFAVRMPAAAAERLSTSSGVVRLSPDVRVSLPTAVRDVGAGGLAGLDRIDQRGKLLDGLFSTSGDGAGVTVHVVGTGVRADHDQFGGRVLPGVSVAGNASDAPECAMHGTHVAGVIAGRDVGVARAALISPVRFIGCDGVGLSSDLIAGMDWMVANHIPGRVAVADLSFAGPRSPALDAAVDAAVAAGIVVVSAAGNEPVDACTRSPGGAPRSVTVSSVSVNDGLEAWAAWGRCVDILAPGGGTLSASSSGRSALATFGGTSISAAFAAGAAALLLGEGVPAADVPRVLEERGTKGAIVGDIRGTPNLLVYVGTGLPGLGGLGSTSTTTKSSTALAGASVLRSTRRDARGRFAYRFTAVVGARSRVSLSVGRRLVWRKVVSPGRLRVAVRHRYLATRATVAVRPVDPSWVQRAHVVRVRIVRN